MKKLLIMSAMVIVTAASFSQEQPKRGRQHEMSPEQQAELQTKKMTLELELTEKQQEQILAINKKNALERKQLMEKHRAARVKGDKLSSEDAFQMKKERLDKQIAHHKELKKILNEKQFEKWKKARKSKAHKMRKKSDGRKMNRKNRSDIKKS
ncbi:MAG: DUF4890 domain-containing protein [Flavobacteriaceae bacterium]|nr:DUF4890 domain-containing protein [Flavobacteriaceae bacterium]